MIVFKSPIIFLVLAQRWIQRLAHRGNPVNDRAFEALSVITPIYLLNPIYCDGYGLCPKVHIQSGSPPMGVLLGL